MTAVFGKTRRQISEEEGLTEKTVNRTLAGQGRRTLHPAGQGGLRRRTASPGPAGASGLYGPALSRPDQWMTLIYRKVDKASAWLQIPYLLLVAFAGYLNLGVWLLNRL